MLEEKKLNKDATIQALFRGKDYLPLIIAIFNPSINFVFSNNLKNYWH